MRLKIENAKSKEDALERAKLMPNIKLVKNEVEEVIHTEYYVEAEEIKHKKHVTLQIEANNQDEVESIIKSIGNFEIAEPHNITCHSGYYFVTGYADGGIFHPKVPVVHNIPWLS